MLLAAIAAVPALQTAPRGQTIGRGTVHLEGLPTGPGNLLPPLTHMYGGGESITHLDPTQIRPAMRHSDYSGSWDFSVPDIVYGVGVDAVHSRRAQQRGELGPTEPGSDAHSVDG